jgi:chromosome partitioning protein
MAYKLAIANQKGGVGKTTISMGVAGVLAEADKKVLLIDMDQQGNLSSSFIENIHSLPHTVYDLLTDSVEIGDVIYRTKVENINILPANLSLSDLDTKLAGDFDAQYNLLEALNEIIDAYDYVIMDCPPNLGTATRMALVAANGIIVPIECQEWSVKGSSQLTAYVEKVRKRANPDLEILGFVINKYDPRRTIEKSYNEVLRDTYGSLIFQTEFHNNVQYTESATAKLPISFYMPGSPQAELFRQFTLELIKKHVKEEIIT